MNVQVTVSPELSAIAAAADLRSTLVPSEGSAHVSAVSVFGCPSLSTSRYVPSARPATVFDDPEVPSPKLWPATVYDQSTPGGLGSVLSLITIEPEPPPAPWTAAAIKVTAAARANTLTS